MNSYINSSYLKVGTDIENFSLSQEMYVLQYQEHLTEIHW